MELTLVTDIAAPAERCFDLARSVEAHLQSGEASGERAVDGRLSGELQLGETVTWEARHLGVRRRLTVRITAFDRPRFFQDRMTRGAFKSFEHDHYFAAVGENRTRMTDVLRFESPGGAAGQLLSRWIIGPHLRKFLSQRNQVLKELAETGATAATNVENLRGETPGTPGAK